MTGIQAVNILFRDDTSKKFHPMGSRGKYFSMGEWPQEIKLLTR